MTDRDPFEAELDRKGLVQVRHLFYTGGYPSSLNLRVTEWIAAQEAEERTRSDAVAAADRRMAHKAHTVAMVAAIAAISANVLTIITIIVSVLTWLYPKR